MVGNEVLTDTDDKLSDALVPAMQNVHAALVLLGLADKIKVSTVHSMAVLESSFPPSAATFMPSLLPIMKPLLKFLEETGAPFMVNTYPYFSYRENPKEVSLDYVLFVQSPGVKDPKDFTYNNMLDAQIDSVYSAMAALGHNDSIPVTSNAGTPIRPNRVIDTYIFPLFNENQKPVPTTERNFGLLQPDGSKVYDVDLSCGYCGAAAPAPAPPPAAPLPMQWVHPNKVGVGGAIWCIAKPSAEPSVVQESLDFSCGQGGADCSAICQGGPC